MLKKVIMVVSIVFALMCIACSGVCVFNLPTTGNLLGLAIGMIVTFSLFACGFIYIALLAHADIITEYYEEAEEAEADEEDKNNVKFVFISEA